LIFTHKIFLIGKNLAFFKVFGRKYKSIGIFSNGDTWIEKLADRHSRSGCCAGFYSRYTAGLIPSLTGCREHIVVQDTSRQLVDPSSCLR